MINSAVFLSFSMKYVVHHVQICLDRLFYLLLWIQCVGTFLFISHLDGAFFLEGMLVCQHQNGKPRNIKLGDKIARTEMCVVEVTMNEY